MGIYTIRLKCPFMAVMHTEQMTDSVISVVIKPENHHLDARHWANPLKQESAFDSVKLQCYIGRQLFSQGQKWLL